MTLCVGEERIFRGARVLIARVTDTAVHIQRRKPDGTTVTNVIVSAKTRRELLKSERV